jgi:hypothetical protein
MEQQRLAEREKQNAIAEREERERKRTAERAEQIESRRWETSNMVELSGTFSKNKSSFKG